MPPSVAGKASYQWLPVARGFLIGAIREHRTARTPLPDEPRSELAAQKAMHLPLFSE